LCNLENDLLAIFAIGEKQQSALFESLIAAVLLMKMYRTERENGNIDKLNKFWQRITNAHLFTKDKFIATLDNNGNVVFE
jgi:hypothetical protein